MGKFISKKFSRHIFEALVDHSFGGIVILDRNGVIKYSSDTIKEILGVEPEMVIGKKYFEFIDSQDFQAVKEVVKCIPLSERKFIHTELKLKHGNNQTIKCEINIKNLLKDKTVNGIVIYYHEKSKENLHQSIELPIHQSKADTDNGGIVEVEKEIRREHPEFGQIMDSINQIDIVNKGIRKKVLSIIKRSKTYPVTNLLSDNEIIKNPVKSVSKDQRLREMNLTRREMEVLDQVIKGCSNKEIARLLHISDHTVKNHMTKILRKLDVSDRSQAIVKIYQRGFNSER